MLPDPSFQSAASVTTLKQRSVLLQQLRAFFDSAGYWEVQTPLLSHDIVVDAHLDPFVVHDGSHPMFLQTSPEFAMKRLLASGADSIFEVTPAFRRAEAGTRHNPEFTMVEWYGVGTTYFEQMDFVEQLVGHLAGSELSQLQISGGTFDRMSYEDAFERFVGTRVMDKSTAQLEDLAIQHDVQRPQGANLNRDDWLNLLLAECVEPNLGTEDTNGPVFLYDYPASQSALARVRQDAGQPAVAERFELYIDGVELCNGYQELTDAQELRTRTIEQNRLRKESGLQSLPADNRLLLAMESGLPDCSGVALGFDRLAMLLLGKTSLQDVIAFPFDRA